MNHRERFLAAVRGEPVDRTPVFPLLMHFAADRAGMTYREYATNGAALAHAQLCVQDRFGLDAVTACSDAFRISADLGGDMTYPVDKPPHLSRPLLTHHSDLSRLGRPDPLESGSRMADRVRAVREMVAGANGETAVLGWVDMPVAEACSLCGVQPFLMMIVDEPDGARRLLSHLTKVVIDFALAQVKAGADMIGAGDAAASLISPAMYRQFALPYEQRVCEAIHEAGALVKLHVCGNTTKLLHDMAHCSADLYNVDHMVPLEEAREAYAAHSVCFKGNLDPVQQVMQATPDQCGEWAREAIAAGTAGGARYMLSAGCEIPAATPDEVFAAFCEAAATSHLK
jgi:MtaA/CmuA family methyltransferase